MLAPLTFKGAVLEGGGLSNKGGYLPDFTVVSLTHIFFAFLLTMLSLNVRSVFFIFLFF